MRTMFDPDHRRALLERLRRLDPTTPPRWGRMRAPQMVAHLTDQLHHTLGDSTPAARNGPLRNRLVRWLSIYVVPWPKGRVRGPPEAFVTQPGEWAADVAGLEALVARFAARSPADAWPEHALFGSMSGKDWGVFCHKHWDHHLRQFGV